MQNKSATSSKATKITIFVVCFVLLVAIITSVLFIPKCNQDGKGDDLTNGGSNNAGNGSDDTGSDPDGTDTPHSHTIVIDEAVEPTCEGKGLTEGKHCSTCNEVIVAQTEVSALGHSINMNYDDMYHFEGCENCEYKGMEAPHLFAVAEFDENTHTIACECGLEYVGDHDYANVNWSYDNDSHFKVCRICDENGLTAEHRFDETVDFDENTHTIACECGLEYIEDHDYTDVEWEHTSTYHFKTCDVCGVEGARENHFFQRYWQDPQDGATYYADYCLDCEYLDKGEELSDTYQFFAGTEYELRALANTRSYIDDYAILCDNDIEITSPIVITNRTYLSIFAEGHTLTSTGKDEQGRYAMFIIQDYEGREEEWWREINFYVNGGTFRAEAPDNQEAYFVLCEGMQYETHVYCYLDEGHEGGKFSTTGNTLFLMSNGSLELNDDTEVLNYYEADGDNPQLIVDDGASYIEILGGIFKDWDPSNHLYYNYYDYYPYNYVAHSHITSRENGEYVVEVGELEYEYDAEKHYGKCTFADCSVKDEAPHVIHLNGCVMCDYCAVKCQNYSTNMFDIIAPGKDFSGDVVIPTVLPNGRMLRIVSENCFEGNSDVENVVFSAGALASYTVDTSAFKDCTNLKSVTFGDGADGAEYITIRDRAFANCKKLERVVSSNMPYNRIGNEAFVGCEKLSSITLAADQEQKGVLTICNNVFNGCSSLKTINIPAGKYVLAAYAFGNCVGLESITFDEGFVIDIFGNKMFEGCINLKTVDLPVGITSIPSYTFDGCTSLESVKIPQGVTVIDTCAFLNCTSLKAIELPSGMTAIKGSAFYGCTGLESVFIPKSLKSIVNKAFFNCTSLKNVYYEGSEADWSSVNISTAAQEDNTKAILTNATKHYNCVGLPESEQQNSATALSTLKTERAVAPAMLKREEN